MLRLIDRIHWGDFSEQYPELFQQICVHRYGDTGYDYRAEWDDENKRWQFVQNHPKYEEWMDCISVYDLNAFMANEFGITYMAFPMKQFPNTPKVFSYFVKTPDNRYNPEKPLKDHDTAFVAALKVALIHCNEQRKIKELLTVKWEE